MTVLSRIFVYPIKSCRGIEVSEAQLAARGLEGDRRYMLVDAKGHFITQRQFPKMALIHIAATEHGYRLSAPGQTDFELPSSIKAGELGATVCQIRVWRHTGEATLAPADANIWFSRYLGFACGLVYLADDQHRSVANDAASFDDEVSFADGAPVLLTSEESLADLNTRLEKPITMTRFRPNLVVRGGLPYAEDEWQAIGIGETRFDVGWACTRCILTTVDPETGQRCRDGEPLRTLKKYRRRDREVYFGQNLLPRRFGSIAIDMPLAIE